MWKKKKTYTFVFLKPYTSKVEATCRGIVNSVTNHVKNASKTQIYKKKQSYLISKHENVIYKSSDSFKNCSNFYKSTNIVHFFVSTAVCIKGPAGPLIRDVSWAEHGCPQSGV